MNETPILNVSEKNKLETDYHHVYSNNCRCMSCLQMFLAIQSGAVKVMSADGSTEMELPRKTATIFTPKPKQ